LWPCSFPFYLFILVCYFFQPINAVHCQGINFTCVTESVDGNSKDDVAWGFPFLAYCCFPLHSTLSYGNQPSALGGNDDIGKYAGGGTITAERRCISLPWRFFQCHQYNIKILYFSLWYVCSFWLPEEKLEHILNIKSVALLVIFWREKFICVIQGCW
jgi:hypothetical protein